MLGSSKNKILELVSKVNEAVSATSTTQATTSVAASEQPASSAGVPPQPLSPASFVKRIFEPVWGALGEIKHLTKLEQLAQHGEASQPLQPSKIKRAGVELIRQLAEEDPKAAKSLAKTQADDLVLHLPSRPAQSAKRISYDALLANQLNSGANTSTVFGTMLNGEEMIVKCSPLESPSTTTYDIPRFIKEMDILATSLHPSILRIKAICLPNSLASTAAGSNAALNTPTLGMARELILAQPLVNVLGPDLREIDTNKRWTFERMLGVGIQMAEAMHELHLSGLIHGELTPANLLITPGGDIKIGDFHPRRYALNPPAPEIATAYCAPEILQNSKQPTEKSDVYSFGCVLLAIAQGYEPWLGASDNIIRDAVLRDRQTPAIPTDENIDPALIDIIKRCTAYDPSQRPTFDEIAITLRNRLDVAVKLVPVTQIAPSGFANLSDTNFGKVGELSRGTSLVESKDAIKLRQKLQPLTDDAVTLAREKFLSQLGNIDPYMIVAKRVDAPSFYVVHRPNGNVALVTSGLWDPGDLSTTDQASNALLGMELMAEAPESECSDLSNSWLYQCLLEVACTAKRNGPKLRRLLRERQYATMEVMDVKLPKEFLDPTTGRACMLLGIEGKDVPKSFVGADASQVVNVVTARLLTLVQWRDSQEFAFGKKPLAARFVREGTYHISSIVSNRAVEVSKPDVDKPKPHVDKPRPDKYKDKILTDDPMPDASWTVIKLMQRVQRAQHPDGGIGQAAPATTTVVPPTAGGGAVAGAPAVSAGPNAGIPTTMSSSLMAQLRSMPAGTEIPAVDFTVPLAPFPDLGDISEYEPPVSTGVIVSTLVTGGIATVLSALTQEMRRILAPNSTASEKLRTIAQTIFGALATQSQLYGWQHVSEYIRNPALYIERTKPVQKAGSTVQPTGGTASAAATTAAAADAPAPAPAPTPRGPSELHEAVDALQEDGHAIIKRLIQRIDWLRIIFTREGRKISTEFFVELLGTDTAWMTDANQFMKNCEERVAELLARNPQRFNQFRELQKKGVQWPHSSEFRKEIENAGFVFRPMMIKRDRCLCDTCGVEVSGWRPWHEVRAFHDYSKHSQPISSVASTAPAAPTAATTAAAAAAPATAPVPATTAAGGIAGPDATAKTSTQKYARYYDRNGVEIQPGGSNGKEETLLGLYIRSVNAALSIIDDKNCRNSFMNFMNSPLKKANNDLMRMLLQFGLLTEKGVELRKLIAGFGVEMIGLYFPEIASIQISLNGDGNFVDLIAPRGFGENQRPEPSALALELLASTALQQNPSAATTVVAAASAPVAAAPPRLPSLTLPPISEADSIPVMPVSSNDVRVMKSKPS